MQKLEIYLDLDGVCVDFITAALTATGHDSNDVLHRWEANHLGEFFPHEGLGIDAQRFWDELAALGEGFWSGLAPYPWFDVLYENLTQLGYVVFCTSSTVAPSCLAGKLQWLQARFGSDFRDYILTSHKDRLAHGRACLIDDFDDNISKFSERGGIGVLFPQFWNSNHAVRHDAVAFALDRVRMAGNA